MSMEAFTVMAIRYYIRMLQSCKVLAVYKPRYVSQVFCFLKYSQLPVGAGTIFQHFVYIGYPVPAAQVI